MALTDLLRSGAFGSLPLSVLQALAGGGGADANPNDGSDEEEEPPVVPEEEDPSETIARAAAKGKLPKVPAALIHPSPPVSPAATPPSGPMASPGPPRPWQSAIGNAVRGAVAAGATPNIAGGGPTDILRGLQAGMSMVDTRNLQQRAMQRQAVQDALSQGKTQAEIARDQAQAEMERQHGLYYQNRTDQERNRFKLDPKTGSILDTQTGELTHPPQSLQDKIKTYKDAGYPDDIALSLAATGKYPVPQRGSNVHVVGGNLVDDTGKVIYKGEAKPPAKTNEYDDFKAGYLKDHPNADLTEISTAYSKAKQAPERSERPPHALVIDPATQRAVEIAPGTPVPRGAMPVGAMGSKNKADKQNIYKAYTPALDSAERFNTMTKNYEDAMKGDQQAMLSLLTNHLAMTMGNIKGGRLNKAIIDEAIKSRPYLQGLKARFDSKSGYLSGVTLTPQQMQQMVSLGQERFAQDLEKARNQAQYLGAADDGPKRTPNRSTMNYYLVKAGNDVAKAKAMAKADGWSVE